MKNKKIGFIGAGNIASAIISGILKSDYIIPENISVFDIDKAKIEDFSDLGIGKAFSSKKLVETSDYIFLTVKPQVYPSLIEEIKDETKGKCFISVAAGITIDFVESILGCDTSIIRVMPNTPLTVGRGSTALVKGKNATCEQFEFINRIFSSSGVTVMTNEEHINTVTAISGSSPAFILQFAKNLIDFGISQGMDESDVKYIHPIEFLGGEENA